MLATAQISDPLHRIQAAGFTLALEDNDLVVVPASRLSAKQRAFIQRHKAALVALLNDAHTLHEALYSERRMVNRNGRRFLHEGAGVRP